LHFRYLARASPANNPARTAKRRIKDSLEARAGIDAGPTARDWGACAQNEQHQRNHQNNNLDVLAIELGYIEGQLANGVFHDNNLLYVSLSVSLHNFYYAYDGHRKCLLSDQKGQEKPGFFPN
jgi:hypothetical protein